MSYYGRRPANRAPLTPPADLVGHYVSWRPKGADGKRYPTVRGHVDSYDAEARMLVITTQREVSMWQSEPTRTDRIALSHGPFTVTR